MEDLKSLYERLSEAGCQLDTWQSDLYVLDTEEARAAIAAFKEDGGIANDDTFVSEVDGKRWIELPFANDPHWVARHGASAEEPISPAL